MKNLFAPWRIAYILRDKSEECAFCIPKIHNEDAERLILFRGLHNFVLLNKYPYANGHIMVTPYRHLQNFVDLNFEETTELMTLLKLCANILTNVLQAQGLNIGLNQGEAAGAGIKEHLHFHLVPRWNGDYSFMPVFNETRIIPEHLQATYEKLLPFFTSTE